MDLSDKTVVVTGAASGIGAATAVDLRNRGATVIGVDVQPASHVDEFVPADLSLASSIDELVDSLPRGINGLCNVAGVPPTAPAEQVLAVNAVGLQYLTERLVAKLADGASIVNVASLAGNRWRESVDQIRELGSVGFDGIAGFVAKHHLDADARSYFLSKEYLLVWTYRSRWRWRERGVRMNAVSPGPVDTPIFPDFEETLGARADTAMRVMDRIGQPQDVAPVIAFLLTDESAWIRGANLPVDGGMASHYLMQAHHLD